MQALSIPQLIAVAVLPLLFAITVHEVAHGWVAKRLGDPTAERLGRLTLNPIKHIDPLGTVLLPLLLLAVSGFAFGWAKPVPVTWENLRHPKRDMALVALAGPAANLVMAVAWGLIAKLSLMLPNEARWVADPLYLMGQFGIFVNAIFMVLNLLPLPPLDGGRVAVGLLPGPAAWQLSRIEPFGLWIVLILLATGLLGKILSGPLMAVVRIISTMTGLR